MGRGSDAEPPLQLRVSTLEDTIDSVNSTAHGLETTMSEIVTLLRGSTHPEASNLQPTRSVAPPANDMLPNPTPIASPQVSASVAPLSYRDTARPTATTVPRVSATSTPAVSRGLCPNGSTTLPPEFDSAMKSPMGRRQRRR
jgi:hypothetical protein